MSIINKNTKENPYKVFCLLLCVAVIWVLIPPSSRAEIEYCKM